MDIKQILYVAAMVLATTSAAIALLSWRRTGRLKPAALAPVALAVACAVAGWLIVTDRQRIEQLLDRVQSAVEDNQPEMLADLVSEDFSLQLGTTTAELTGRDVPSAALQATRMVYPIRSASITRLGIDVQGRSASALISVKTVASSGPTADQPLVTDWSVTLVKHQDQWLIETARLKTVAGQPAANIVPGSGLRLPSR